MIPQYYKYQHISFDCWLTLIRSHPSYKPKRDELFKEFFGISHSPQEISDVVRHFDLYCNNQNELTGENIETNEIYMMILKHLGFTSVEHKKLNDFYHETELLLFKYMPLIMWPNIKSFLHKLKAENIGMNILSNTGFIKGRTLRKLMRHYEIEQYFDFQIYSDECGYSKPSENIFKAVYQNAKLQQPCLSSSKILHVGDNRVADYDGAKKYGFNAFLIQN